MKETKLNDEWLFWWDGNAFSLVWDIPSEAREIRLPHDAMLENPANPESINGGNTGFRDGGSYTYLKKLFVPKEAEGKVLKLKFEGVYMNAMVYVNQQFAAKSVFGYTTFYVELDEFLHYGAVNEIRVQVGAGAMTNSRWYSGAGIYRDVYLLESERTYLIPEGMKIKTEDADEACAVIHIRTEIENRECSARELILETSIYDQNQSEVNTERVRFVLFGNESRELTQRLTVDDPCLWNDEAPVLYSCVSRLYEKDEKLIDEEMSPFGIRTLQLDARRGLRVNGKVIKLRGACIHHDSGLLGSATYEAAQLRQIKKLKEAGFNAIRMSHHPIAPAMLRACDEVGMYVMDEAFDMWNRMKSNYDYGLYFSEWWEKDLTAMIRKDYNHPSVIMYSAGNEIPDIGMEHGAKTCHEICTKMKELDDTRYVLAAINGVFAVGDQVEQIVKDMSGDAGESTQVKGNVNEFMTLMNERMDEIVTHPIISKRIEMASASMDITGYNYMVSRYEMDAKKYPNRVMVGSETCPPEIANIWRLVKKLPALIGDFTWTGWDYLGEAGVGIPAYQWGEGGFGARYPAQLAYVGDFDITGYRRPMSYYREIVFGLRKEPYIAVQNPNHYGEQLIKTPWVMSDTTSSWNWQRCEGNPVIVEVYASGEEVELLINGISKGRKKTGEATGFRTLFECTYELGSVEAIAYDAEGTELGRMRLDTAEADKRLLLRQEAIKDKELVFINVELTDSKGNVHTDCDCQLRITDVEGAEILGFGSGNPKPSYNFNEGVTETYFGRAQIIARRQTDAAGKICVQSEEGLTGTLVL